MTMMKMMMKMIKMMKMKLMIDLGGGRRGGGGAKVKKMKFAVHLIVLLSGQQIYIRV